MQRSTYKELLIYRAWATCDSNRHFVWSWLKRFPWLAYSKYLDGAFCLPCVLFGVQCGRNTNKLDKSYKSPLTLWTSAISRFTKHASGKCEMHNLAVIAMGNFLRNMRREAVPIDQQINNLLQRQISKIREILKSLFKTVIFCGKNNIALRGRRDDDPQNASLSGNDHVYLRHLSAERRSILSTDMATDTRPIYRPTLGRYVGRDSVECRSTCCFS